MIERDKEKLVRREENFALTPFEKLTRWVVNLFTPKKEKETKDDSNNK